MDEDELAEIRGAVAVQPTADFDTFGSAAAEAEKRKARADAAESNSQAPSLTAGPIIEELLAPVAESLGDILQPDLVASIFAGMLCQGQQACL